MAVTDLAVGGLHTCALLDNGAVRCWGSGGTFYGPLGYGNTITIGDNETPASAGDIPLGGIATRITVGGFHMCALLDTGAVRCWGTGTEGQLGYPGLMTVGDDETPASVGDVVLGGPVVDVVAGVAHNCALFATGSVVCWGEAGNGQLGYGNVDNIGDNEVPVAAGFVNVGGTVTQLVGGEYHTCALLDTGHVRCWGEGVFGQLGYGNPFVVGDNEVPASAGDVNVGGTVVQLAAGNTHTCALLDTGSVRCWGRNFYGELGYGNSVTIGDDEVPAVAGDVPVGGTVTAISAGSYETCALLATGAVRCWGDGAFGTPGYSTIDDIGDDETPAAMGDVSVGGSVHIIRANLHVCALLDSGAVRCWGKNNLGQLGYANTNNIGDDELPSSAGDVTILP